MVVTFDKFSKFEQPQLVLCNPSSVYSNGVITNAIGTIFNPTDIDLNIHFNAKSELSFVVGLVDTGDDNVNESIRDIFDMVEVRRYVYIEGVGYFVISDAQKKYGDGGYYKEVRAESAEKELENRGVPYISDGTYPFVATNGSGIMNIVSNVMGKWSLRYIDPELRDVYRTFEDVDVSQNVYNFMIDEIQDAYECVFIFDTVERKIDVYLRKNYIVTTDIHLTNYDWIKESRKISEAEKVYTALRVNGDSDVGVSAVNPNGTNVIYDFSYYYSWMSTSLATKVSLWQTQLAASESTYYHDARSYYNLYGSKMNTQAEIDRLNIVLSLYQQCVVNIETTQSTNSVGSFNVLISQAGGETIDIQATIQDTIDEIELLESEVESDISTQQNVLSSIEQSMQPYYDSMEQIRSTLSITSYFTVSEYEELQCYIFEGNYTDSYITVSDSMSEAEKIDQMRILMSKAKRTLSDVSSPTYEYEMDVESFPLIKEYEYWTQQLQTGCLVHAQTDLDELSELFVSDISISYEDRHADITFGNRLLRQDARSLFRDALDNITRSANSIIY